MIALPCDIEAGCQRWRRRRDSYRPAGETINASRYGVEILEDDATPKRFVVEHHYAGSYPSARCRVALYRMRELVGVAVFSHPASEEVLPKWLPNLKAVELGRLVLLDDVPGNGETWFMARALPIARAELAVDAVLSFSDPFVRTTQAGEIVKPGHVGTVYQALGGRYLGRSNRATQIFDPMGRIVSRRTISKVSTEDRGSDGYCARQLQELGAPPRKAGETGAQWWKRCLREAAWRRVRHPGNYAYAWAVAAGVELPDAKTPPCSWCGECHEREPRLEAA